jgi:hypothetical protein
MKRISRLPGLGAELTIVSGDRGFVDGERHCRRLDQEILRVRARPGVVIPHRDLT